MKNIVLFSYGNVLENRRAIYCIFSILAWKGEKAGDLRIILYTDHPAYCDDFLAGLGVHMVLLTAERMQQMLDGAGFNQRIKICILQDVHANFPDEDMLYVDSDTFFFNDVAPLLDRIQPEDVLMHARECRLGSVNKQYRDFKSRHLPQADGYPKAFMKFVDNNEFTLGGRKLSFNQLHHVWNTGVIGIHHQLQPLLTDILQFSDHIYLQTKSCLSEQLAFSLILQSFSKIRPALDYIVHYNMNKELVDYFINKTINHDFMESNADDKLSIIKASTETLNKLVRLDVFVSMSGGAFRRRRYRRGLKYAFRAICNIPLSPWSLAYIKSMYTFHMFRKDLT